MTSHGNWPRVAVVGAGAVGCYFGGLLARGGAPVVMIGRHAFVEAVKAHGLFLDTLHFQERVQVEASSALTAIRGAELVLFCVKSVDNAATARELAPLLSPGATVVTLQNGVDNVEQIRAASNVQAMPAVVYVAASVPQPGHVKHVGRGDLVLSESERGYRLAEMFQRAGIPCRLSNNVQGELWTKLTMNCALNAISAVGNVKYGKIAESAEARKMVRLVVEEVLAVAHAAGVILPSVPNSDAAFEGSMKIATQMADAFSSTAQDVHRGKLTEIDSLNGYISRRGAELGVPTPANDILTTLVRLLELSTR
jgi:2-dehydropantoate 2-reductase